MGVSSGLPSIHQHQVYTRNRHAALLSGKNCKYKLVRAIYNVIVAREAGTQNTLLVKSCLALFLGHSPKLEQVALAIILLPHLLLVSGP